MVRDFDEDYILQLLSVLESVLGKLARYDEGSFFSSILSLTVGTFYHGIYLWLTTPPARCYNGVQVSVWSSKSNQSSQMKIKIWRFNLWSVENKITCTFWFNIWNVNLGFFKCEISENKALYMYINDIFQLYSNS